MFHSGMSGVSNSIRRTALCIAAGMGAALLVGVTAALITPTPAGAKVEFAGQTGLPCGQCHMNPSGSGKLKAFGEKFKANGFKVKK